MAQGPTDISGKPTHLRDIEVLSAGQLAKKYETTYSSWRNMKQRRSKGAFVAPEFEIFASFLAIMGPRPEGCTLDRIDFKNQTYGPGLVRWLDSVGQANNRSNTKFLTDNAGQRRTLTEWARLTGQKPDTLRDRFSKDWAEDEVIHGRSSTRGAGNLVYSPWTWRPWLRYDAVKAERWENNYQKNGGYREAPINFFLERLGARRVKWVEALEEMQFDEGPDAETRRRELIEAVDRAFTDLQWARAVKTQMPQHVARYRLKEPRDWVGPKRFPKPTPARTYDDF